MWETDHCFVRLTRFNEESEAMRATMKVEKGNQMGSSTRKHANDANKSSLHSHYQESIHAYAYAAQRKVNDWQCVNTARTHTHTYAMKGKNRMSNEQIYGLVRRK